MGHYVFPYRIFKSLKNFLCQHLHTAKLRLTLRTIVDYLRTRGKSWEPIFWRTQSDPFFDVNWTDRFSNFDQNLGSKYFQKAAQISSTDENFPS